MDILYIHDLRIDTVIGVYDWERRIRQTVVFDIDLGVDVRKAAASDAIGDAVDYGEVAQRVIAFVEASHFTLVETLAEKVAEFIQNEFKVPWRRLKLNKRCAACATWAWSSSAAKSEGGGHEHQRERRAVDAGIGGGAGRLRPHRGDQARGRAGGRHQNLRSVAALGTVWRRRQIHPAAQGRAQTAGPERAQGHPRVLL